jgi:hypothetical protein
MRSLLTPVRITGELASGYFGGSERAYATPRLTHGSS